MGLSNLIIDDNKHGSNKLSLSLFGLKDDGVFIKRKPFLTLKPFKLFIGSGRRCEMTEQSGACDNPALKCKDCFKWIGCEFVKVYSLYNLFNGFTFVEVRTLLYILSAIVRSLQFHFFSNKKSYTSSAFSIFCFSNKYWGTYFWKNM